MTNKLRINILTYNPSFGGGDRVVAIYARKLKDMGHDVHIIALKPPAPPIAHRIKRFMRTGKFIKNSFSTERFSNAGLCVRVVEGKQAIENCDVPDGDILIATFWLTAEWAINLSAQKGAKTYLIQGYEAAFPYAPAARVRATYTAPFSKIAVSNWLNEMLRENVQTEAFAVIPNSVDHDQFYAPPRNKNQRPSIGFLYSTSENKGVDVTMRAVQLMRDTIPDLKTIAFSTHHPTRKLPLPDGCEFYHRPAQDKIRNIYAKCDLWLSASRMEGFNLTLLEAMACRTPVIATRAGAAPDLIDDGVEGYVTPIDDYAALAHKAASVLQSSDDKWRRMSDAAYEKAISYSWDDAAALFEKALLEIAAAEKHT
ncbi:glycosyltransferase family 4 protein [Hyphococcus sp.]|uniref:glycosyltransferase family 4 protein n=1 Tax=Hyphococcus sp. TaxID=2038636 RepID=UPI003CCBED82